MVLVNEPPHDKTNKMVCAPSKDSDQPGHPPSLIRVFAVHMKDHWVLSYQLIERTGKTLIRLGGCPGWSESSLGAQTILFVLSRGGSNTSQKSLMRNHGRFGSTLFWKLLALQQDPLAPGLLYLLLSSDTLLVCSAGYTIDWCYLYLLGMLRRIF